MLAAMDAAGIRCTIIGRVEDESFGIMSGSGSSFTEIEPPYADEIYKVVGQ